VSGTAVREAERRQTGAMAGSSGRQLDWILGGGALAFIVLLGFVSSSSMELTEGFKVLLDGSFLIGSVVAALLVAWHVWNRPTTPTARELSQRFEAVRYMSGGQFEVFIADLFRAMGHQAVVLGGTGDQGVDIIVNRRGERVAVQCKNHIKPVNNKAVQEVYAGARHHRCAEACVVAPAGYTRGAIDLARSTEVSLFDADSIHQWISNADKLEKERASETKSEIKPENTPLNKEITEARKRAIWHPHPDDPPKS
jgi:restriction system protein